MKKEKEIIFQKISNLDLKGALRNLQHKLHLFLENIEPRTENKNSSLGKAVFKWGL